MSGIKSFGIVHFHFFLFLYLFVFHKSPTSDAYAAFYLAFVFICHLLFIATTLMLKCYTTISKDTWKIEGFTSSIPYAALYIFKNTCSNKAIITHWKINKWLYLWWGQTCSSSSASTGTLCQFCAQAQCEWMFVFSLSLYVLLLFSSPHCIGPLSVFFFRLFIWLSWTISSDLI